MLNIIKTILLVGIFYVLILFSFLWFNRDNKNIKDVPCVQEFFQVVSVFSENTKNIFINEINFKNILNIKKNNKKNFEDLNDSNNNDSWDYFLNK